ERMKKNPTEVPFHEDAISLFFSDISPLPARKQVLHLEKFQLNVEERQLVSNIHFNLNGQEKIGIIGQNGIGKSSFLKLIYQELRQRADINLGYMPQRYSEVLDESKTPLDFLIENGNR
ncbi:ATP-binding cassette domain-containing protein, partial [Streptococcus suis]|uniref:ATP-binding cassette domain-containing protein n=1 Tax=Streptococcus suis TaxID=1307 RepID=UPI00129001CD